MNFFENLHDLRDANEKKGEYTEDLFDQIVYYESVSIATKGLELQFMDILTIFTAIDFSNNRFNGEIPEVFGELHSIIVLNLSHNSLNTFIGPIPRGNQYNGNLGLCGFPLSKNCSNDQGLEPPPTIQDEDDDTTRALDWKFATLMGYGCGVVLGLSMGHIVFTTGNPWWLIRDH
ncbi:hypothetical protein CRYUN_Cryun26dG0110300 [Craigia yunnanensis]